MSNGDFKPKDRYRTSGISARGGSTSHLTSLDMTAPFKQAVMAEEKRVEEELLEHELKQKLIHTGLNIGTKALSTRQKHNQAWLEGDEANVYLDYKGKGKGVTEGSDVFRASDDFMTRHGWAKQTVEFTPDMISKLSDQGELANFLQSEEGTDIMSMIHRDPKRFTRLPQFNKGQWDELMDIAPDEMHGTLTGWLDDPASAPKKFLDWGMTPNKDEAGWATSMGATDTADLGKSCLGTRGGKCFSK